MSGTLTTRPRCFTSTFEFCFPNRFNLTIRASLASNLSLYCESYLIFVIHDIPERPTFLENQNWSGGVISSISYINETASVGTVIGNPLLFNDPDLNDSHTFSLQCVDSLVTCPFGIDETGIVSLQHLDYFDYEIKEEWAIRIRVTDSSVLFDEMMLSIHLVDINEPPYFSQPVVYRVGSYPPRLFDTIGVPVTAIDPENNIVEYSLSDSSLFSIDSVGQIRLISLSVNPWMSYNVTVTATDSEGLNGSALVIISFNTNNTSSFVVRPQSYTLAEDHPVNVVILPALSALLWKGCFPARPSDTVPRSLFSAQNI